jgi:glycosyltransferase involved in cell wall biosynthesis
LILLLLKKPKTTVISIPPVNQLFSLFAACRIAKSEVVIDYRDEFEDFLVLYGLGSAAFYRFLKVLLSSFYRRSRLMVTVTPAVATSLQSRGTNNTLVIHDGVDTNEFKPMNKVLCRKKMGIPLDAFVVVYLGNVYGPYRVDVIVDALKKIEAYRKEREYLLLLVGGGDMSTITKRASAIGIESAVKYTGQMNNTNDVVMALNAADVGLIPYDDSPLWKRTLSTKLFEYCACGIPVIATVMKDSILRSYIEKYSLGTTVPPLDSQALADAIVKMTNFLEEQPHTRLKILAFAKEYDREILAERLLAACD